MAEIPNSVSIPGTLAPTDHRDTYAVTDPKYQKGGYRECASVDEMNAIPTERRTEGMLVAIPSATAPRGNVYYTLKDNTFIPISFGEVWEGTYEEYMALTNKDPNILYSVDAPLTEVSAREMKVYGGVTETAFAINVSNWFKVGFKPISGNFNLVTDDGRLKAPVSGTYMFSVAGGWLNTDGNWWWRLSRDKTEKIALQVENTTRSTKYLPGLSGLVQADAGETFTLKGYFQGMSVSNIESGGEKIQINWFLIGATNSIEVVNTTNAEAATSAQTNSSVDGKILFQGGKPIGGNLYKTEANFNFSIKGKYNTLEQLRANVTSPVVGDTYAVGINLTDIYVWFNDDWTKITPLNSNPLKGSYPISNEIWTGTDLEYNALTAKEENKIYFVDTEIQELNFHDYNVYCEGIDRGMNGSADWWARVSLSYRIGNINMVSEDGCLVAPVDGYYIISGVGGKFSSSGTRWTGIYKQNPRTSLAQLFSSGTNYFPNIITVVNLKAGDKISYEFCANGQSSSTVMADVSSDSGSKIKVSFMLLNTDKLVETEPYRDRFITSEYETNKSDEYDNIIFRKVYNFPITETNASGNKHLVANTTKVFTIGETADKINRIEVYGYDNNNNNNRMYILPFVKSNFNIAVEIVNSEVRLTPSINFEMTNIKIIVEYVKTSGAVAASIPQGS